MEAGGHRQIGRPTLRWSDITRKYMKEKQVTTEEAQGRRTWRMKALDAPNRNWEKTEKEQDVERMSSQLGHRAMYPFI